MEQHLGHLINHKEADGILFHKNVFFPKALESEAKDFILKMDNAEVFLSQHAREIIKKSEDGLSRSFSLKDVWRAIDFAIERILEGKDVDIFEIGIEEEAYIEEGIKKVCKVGFRCPLDIDRDICLIVGPKGLNFKVITLYVNLKGDEHKEGFKSDRYVQPPKKVTIKIKKNK